MISNLRTKDNKQQCLLNNSKMKHYPRIYQVQGTTPHIFGRTINRKKRENFFARNLYLVVKDSKKGELFCQLE